MGQKLHNFFIKIGELGGIQARTKLSILSKITSVEARTLPDSEENLKKMEESFNFIMKEIGRISTSSPSLGSVVIDASHNVAAKLRKYLTTAAELTGQRNLFQGDMSKTAKRITETLVEAANVERASIWLFNSDKTAIICTDLYVKSTREHSEGVVLKESDFPAYFLAVRTERTLAAVDAHTNPSTAEFSKPYLTPLGIGALLDVPIWANGEMIGVVCHEHVGGAREWTSDEETFAYLMGNIVGMTMEEILVKA